MMGIVAYYGAVSVADGLIWVDFYPMDVQLDMLCVIFVVAL